VNSLLSGKIIDSEDGVILTNSFTEQQISFIKLYGLISEIIENSDAEISSENSSDFLLDDGTGSIMIKGTFEFCRNIKLWDFVRVIGIIKVLTLENGLFEITVIPEAIIPVENKLWEIIHNIECERTLNPSLFQKQTSTQGLPQSPKFDGSIFNSTPQKTSSPPLQEPKLAQTEIDRETKDFSKEKTVTTENNLTELSNKIEHLLRTLDIGDGVEFNQLMSNLGNNIEESVVDDILFELAYEGKVYQPKPEYYKFMD
jgi:hypothetical protein